MTRVCSLCARDEHGKCIGIRCACKATKRCQANALLTLARERQESGENVA